MNTVGIVQLPWYLKFQACNEFELCPGTHFEKMTIGYIIAWVTWLVYNIQIRYQIWQASAKRKNKVTNQQRHNLEVARARFVSGLRNYETNN